MVFKDRRDAGRQLAKSLAYYKGKPVVVFGLPRGGVVVAAEVAKYLGAPLDVLIASKIGHPGNAEFAIGAVAETGKPVWGEAELGSTSAPWRQTQVALARREAKRRHRRYRGDQPRVEIAGKTAIVVDDGIATGLTMTAAVRALYYRNPRSIVVAVPVAPRYLPWDILRYSGARTYVLHAPAELAAIGAYYQNFEQVTDEEVRQLLQAYAQTQEPAVDLAAMNALLSTVAHYPVRNAELTEQARLLHAPASVVEFFESIPTDATYGDKKQIMQLAAEAQLLMEEEAHEPAEYLHEGDP